MKSDLVAPKPLFMNRIGIICTDFPTPILTQSFYLEKEKKLWHQKRQKQT